MISRTQVKVELKKAGVYLSAKTKKGNYGQCYNTVHKEAANYVPSIDEAIERFIEFYNQFEGG